MSNYEIMLLLVRSVPESFLLATCMYVVSRTKINFKHAGLLAVLGAIVSKAVVYLPIGFGVNAVMGILFFLFAFKKLANVKLITSIIATMSAFVGLIISDTLWGMTMNIVFNVPKEQLSALTNPKMLVPCLFSLVIFAGAQFVLKKILDKKFKKD